MLQYLQVINLPICGDIIVCLFLLQVINIIVFLGRCLQQ